MRMSTRIAGIALTAGTVLATAVAADATPPTSRQPHSQTLVFTTPWVGGEQTYIDLGDKGEGPGDVFLVTNLPVNVDGKRIGSVEAVETILSARHHGTVSQQLTLRLPDGRVMIDGIGRHDDSPFQLAVVGGTGKYSTVRGQMLVLGDDEQHHVTIQRLVLHW